MQKKFNFVLQIGLKNNKHTIKRKEQKEELVYKQKHKETNKRIIARSDFDLDLGVTSHKLLLHKLLHSQIQKMHSKQNRNRKRKRVINTTNPI